MGGIDRLLGWVSTLLVWIACAIIPVMFTMIVIDVSIRTLGYRPPLFTSAVVEYALLYMAMLSAPFLVRERGHVAIEALVAALPRVVQRIIAFIVYLVCTASAALFAYYSYLLFIDAWVSGQLDVRSIDLPQWAQFVPMLIGFTLVALEFFMYLIGRRHYYTYDLGEVKDGV